MRRSASAPAGTFDAKPGNRAQLTGILTNLILPGTVLVADIDKAIDNGKGKAALATMGGGNADRDQGRRQDRARRRHRPQGDRHPGRRPIFATASSITSMRVLMPGKDQAAKPAVGQKAG